MGERETRMSDALKDLIGQRVQVETLYGDSGRFTDEGILEFADEQWLRIRKDNGEVMCLAVRRVRFVKGRF